MSSDIIVSALCVSAENLIVFSAEDTIYAAKKMKISCSKFSAEKTESQIKIEWHNISID